MRILLLCVVLGVQAHGQKTQARVVHPEAKNFDTYEDYVEALTDWKIASLKSTGVSVEPLRAELDILRKEVDSLKGALSGLNEWRYEFPLPYALLDTSGDGYSRMMFQGIILLVRLDSVEKYLDGVKVHLRIGNPGSAEYSRFKLYLSWWKRPAEKAALGLLTGSNSAPVKSFDRLESLEPGAWTPLVVTIGGVEPESMGVLEVQITDLDTVKFLK